MLKKEERRIENLAEKNVYEVYSKQQTVDPNKIANHFGIKVYQGDFSDSFKGLIRWDKGKFKIYLNISILKDHNYEFARNTCAHEIGHALIPGHRKMLMNGISLAFNLNDESEISNEIKNVYELQAQSFAAGLLMPSKWLKNYTINQDVSLYYIFSKLKVEFKTSLTSTAVRSMKLNLAKSVFIRISHTLWSVPSASFSKTFDNKRVYFKYNEFRNRNIIECKTMNLGGYDYQLSYTNLSSWASNIPQGSSYDLLVREEMLYTPRFTFCLLSIQN